LKVQAGALSQNLAAITIREEFSNNLINTLNEGSDRLVLADLNEEGANLLALQTSTALATQSLALASQQSQGVLQLLG
jgi:flagellin-like hook-associated protein FlgL